MLLTINECLDEVQRLVNEGYNINEAINKVKGYSKVRKNIENNQEQLINDIIAPNEDIDNDQIYLESNGETLRDL